MRKYFAVAAVATLALFSAAACSGGPGSDAEVTIGFATPVLTNPYWKQNADFSQKVATELGAEVIVADANSSESKQLTNVQNLIAQGVDGIIFGPVTASIGPTILKACQTAKIKCAAVARHPGVEPDASNAGYYVGYVIGDDYRDGQAAAAALEQAGAHNCVVMSGQQGNSVADDRLSGFVDYATSHAMNIMGTFRPVEVASEGLAATENFLAQFPGPEFDCLYAFSGDATTGALSALAKKGVLDKVKVAGLDANSENQKAIAAGRLVASGAGGEFINGGLATIMVYDAIKGHAPTHAAVILDGIVVQKNNVAAYSTQYGDIPTGYDAQQLSRTYNPRATTNDLKIVFN